MTGTMRGMLLAAALGLWAGPALAQANDVVCDRCVGTTDIDTGAVTTGRLSDNAVSAPKLRDGAVTADKIGPSAVTGDKIAPNAVTGDKIAFGAVKTGRISDNAVSTPKLRDGAVTAAKLGLVNTFFIDDSGDDAANCTALLAALASAVGPAAVVLGPGTYACGSNAVVIPAGVSLIGSGRNLTAITGTVIGNGLVVLAGDDTALAQLTVTNEEPPEAVGATDIRAIFVAASGAARRWRLSDVGASAFNGSQTNAAVGGGPHDCDGGEMINVTATVSGGGSNTGFGFICGFASVVSGTNLRATVSGDDAVALHVDQFNGSTFVAVRNSAFKGETFSAQVLGPLEGRLKVVSSEIDGAVDGLVICVGDYDETGAALADGTNGSGGCMLPNGL